MYVCETAMLVLMSYSNKQWIDLIVLVNIIAIDNVIDKLSIEVKQRQSCLPDQVNNYITHMIIT